MASFVLIHGGGHGSWCWQPVLGHLARPALAVDLPGRDGRRLPSTATSIEAMTDAVVDQIAEARLAEPLVLVGHSAAAVLMPELVRKVGGSVGHLVFVAASVPPDGRTVVDTLPWISRPFTRRAVRGERQARSLPRWVVSWMFCNGMTPGQRDVVRRRFAAEAPSFLDEPVSWAGIDSMQRTYVRFTEDRLIRPRTAAEMARRLGITEVVDVPAGHDGMISHPERLARVLNDIASRSQGVRPA